MTHVTAILLAIGILLLDIAVFIFFNSIIFKWFYLNPKYLKNYLLLLAPQTTYNTSCGVYPTSCNSTARLVCTNNTCLCDNSTYYYFNYTAKSCRNLFIFILYFNFYKKNFIFKYKLKLLVDLVKILLCVTVPKV